MLAAQKGAAFYVLALEKTGCADEGRYCEVGRMAREIAPQADLGTNAGHEGDSKEGG
jgi:hypothetical protein